jgi:hypothetical protein
MAYYVKIEGFPDGQVNKISAAEMAEEFKKRHRHKRAGDVGLGVYSYDWLYKKYGKAVDYDEDVLGEACDLLQTGGEEFCWSPIPYVEPPEEQRPRYFKTTFVVEVLSQDPGVRYMDLRLLLDEAEIDTYAAAMTECRVEGLTGAEAAQELIKQGADPGSWGLTDEGAKFN